MAATREKILEHYKSEAEKHQLGGTSTIQDMRTRHLEIEAISSYLRDGYKALEVGCGNGYTAEVLVRQFNIDLEATDLSQDLIALAKERKIAEARGHVEFAQADILELDKVEAYDVIFTERCLQNLLSWDEQKRALSNIVRALKKGGHFIMMESFLTGMNKLNEAREELDLPKIAPPWHNVWFDEPSTIEHVQTLGCSYLDQNRFLSGYYFGSRVLLPALMPKGKPVTSASALNDYFSWLPPYGDFCPHKILRFRRD